MRNRRVLAGAWAGATGPQRLLVVLAFGAALGPQADNVGPAMYSYALLMLVGAVGVFITIPRATWHEPGPAGWVALMLFGYTLLSVLWSGTPNQLSVAGVVVLAAGTAFVPWLATNDPLLAAPMLEQLLRLVCAGVVLASSAHVVLAMVFGGYEPVTQRLPLPIGGASSSAVPLLLCLAVLLDAVLTDRGRRRLWVPLVGLTLVLVVLTGSRTATVLCLVVLAAAAVLVGRRAWVLAALLPGAVLAGGLVMTRPGFSLTDPTRWSTARTAISGWLHHPGDIAFGAGAGEIWPWWELEVGHLPLIGGSVAWESPFGVVLYHPHSVFLGTAVELGLVGLLLLVTFFVLLVRAALQVVRSAPGLRLTGVALLLSLLAMTVEYYIFRNFPGSLVWWCCAWGVITAARARGAVGAAGRP